MYDQKEVEELYDEYLSLDGNVFLDVDVDVTKLDDDFNLTNDFDVNFIKNIPNVRNNNFVNDTASANLDDEPDVSIQLDLLNHNFIAPKGSEFYKNQKDAAHSMCTFPNNGEISIRPTSVSDKKNEIDIELKEIDEKHASPDAPLSKNTHRMGWDESLGLWHSGPSSLTADHQSNNLPQDLSSSVSYNPYEFQTFASSSSSKRTYSHQQLGAKVEMVYSLLSMLDTDNREDMSKTFLAMSSSPESCHAMRQSGCLPLLIQLIHSPELDKEVRNRAAEALHNVVHSQNDEKRRRREMRVLKLLQQIREYCEDIKILSAEKKLFVLDSEKHPITAMGTVMKFSFDAEHRQAICTLGGLHAIAELIQVDHEAHGSTNDDTLCITLRRYAGMSLTNLTFGDGKNKALLCSFNKFMRALVDQLKSPSEDLRQVTASVLRNLSWRADSDSKQTLRQVGAVTALTNSAMEGKKESTLKSILSALWNLSAHCSLNKIDICSVPGALAFLVKMLKYKSASNTLAIVENAGGILRNISSHIAVREDYRQILRDHNCFDVLLEQLKSPSLTIVSNACGTLWNLSARCSEDQRKLWEMGATTMLRSLVQSKHKMISMGSSAALKNLLAANPNGNLLTHLDATAKSLGLQKLPTLFVRKQRALEQELNVTLAETCDNIEPNGSPTHAKAEEKLNAHKRSESRDSVTSSQSDSVYERINHMVHKHEEKLFENKGNALHESLNEKQGSRNSEDQRLMRRYRASMIPTPTFKKLNQDRVNEITKEDSVEERLINTPVVDAKEKTRKGIPVLRMKTKNKITPELETSTSNILPQHEEEFSIDYEELGSLKGEDMENPLRHESESECKELDQPSNLNLNKKTVDDEGTKEFERQNITHERNLNCASNEANPVSSIGDFGSERVPDDEDNLSKIVLKHSPENSAIGIKVFDSRPIFVRGREVVCERKEECGKHRIDLKKECQNEFEKSTILTDLCLNLKTLEKGIFKLDIVDNPEENFLEKITPESCDKPERALVETPNQNFMESDSIDLGKPLNITRVSGPLPLFDPSDKKNIIYLKKIPNECLESFLPLEDVNEDMTQDKMNFEDCTQEADSTSANMYHIFEMNSKGSPLGKAEEINGWDNTKNPVNQQETQIIPEKAEIKSVKLEAPEKPFSDLLLTCYSPNQPSSSCRNPKTLDENDGQNERSTALVKENSIKEMGLASLKHTESSNLINQYLNKPSDLEQLTDSKENNYNNQKTHVEGFLPKACCDVAKEEPKNPTKANLESDSLKPLNNVIVPNFKIGSQITHAKVLQYEANKICREIQRHQEIEMGCSLTSEVSLVSCSSFLDTGDYSLFEMSNDGIDFEESENQNLGKGFSKVKCFPFRKPNVFPTADSVSLPSLGSLKNEQIEALDLDNSVLSVASITSEVADTYVKDHDVFNTYTKTYENDSATECFEETLADGDATLNADLLQNNTELFDDDNSLHSQENLPLDCESFKDLSLDQHKRKMTPKEKRKTFHERYRTYTIRDFRNSNSSRMVDLVKEQGEKDLNNTNTDEGFGDHSPFRNQFHYNNSDGYYEDGVNDNQEQITEHYQPCSTTFHPLSKNDNMKFSKSLDKEYDYISTVVSDSKSLNDLLSVGPAERKELVDNAKLVAFSLKTAIQDFESDLISDTEPDDPDKSVAIDTATYSKSYGIRKFRSEDVDLLNNYEKCVAEDPGKKGPRILKPHEKIEDETGEVLLKGIRGRRKPLYSSPQKNAPRVSSSGSSPHKIPQTTESKKSSNNSQNPPPATLNREGTFTKDDGINLKKTDPKSGRGIPVWNRNQDSKGSVSVRNKSAATSESSTKRSESSRMTRPLSTYCSKNSEKRNESSHGDSQRRPASTGAGNRTQRDNALVAKRHSSVGSSTHNVRTSSSNQNIRASASTSNVSTLKSRSPASHGPVSKSDANLNASSPKEKGKRNTPKKEVTSKIASLWRKVEETKQKNKNVKDSRVWIGGGKTEVIGDEILVIEQEEIVDLPTRKIVHSFTCQGLRQEAPSVSPCEGSTARNNHGDLPSRSSTEEKRVKTERRNIISAVVTPYNYSPPAPAQSAPPGVKLADVFHKGSLKVTTV